MDKVESNLRQLVDDTNKLINADILVNKLIKLKFTNFPDSAYLTNPIDYFNKNIETILNKYPNEPDLHNDLHFMRDIISNRITDKSKFIELFLKIYEEAKAKEDKDDRKYSEANIRANEIYIQNLKHLEKNIKNIDDQIARTERLISENPDSIMLKLFYRFLTDDADPDEHKNIVTILVAVLGLAIIYKYGGEYQYPLSALLIGISGYVISIKSPSTQSLLSQSINPIEELDYFNPNSNNLTRSHYSFESGPIVADKITNKIVSHIEENKDVFNTFLKSLYDILKPIFTKVIIDCLLKLYVLSDDEETTIKEIQTKIQLKLEKFRLTKGLMVNIHSAYTLYNELFPLINKLNEFFIEAKQSPNFKSILGDTNILFKINGFTLVNSLIQIKDLIILTNVLDSLTVDDITHIKYMQSFLEIIKDNLDDLNTLNFIEIGLRPNGLILDYVNKSTTILQKIQVNKTASLGFTALSISRSIVTFYLKYRESNIKPFKIKDIKTIIDNEVLVKVHKDGDDVVEEIIQNEEVKEIIQNEEINNFRLSFEELSWWVPKKKFMNRKGSEITYDENPNNSIWNLKGNNIYQTDGTDSYVVCIVEGILFWSDSLKLEKILTVELDNYNSGLNIKYDKKNSKITFVNKITNVQIGKEFDVEFEDEDEEFEESKYDKKAKKEDEQRIKAKKEENKYDKQRRKADERVKLADERVKLADENYKNVVAIVNKKKISEEEKITEKKVAFDKLSEEITKKAGEIIKAREAREAIKDEADERLRKAINIEVEAKKKLANEEKKSDEAIQNEAIIDKAVIDIVPREDDFKLSFEELSWWVPIKKFMNRKGSEITYDENPNNSIWNLKGNNIYQTDGTDSYVVCIVEGNLFWADSLKLEKMSTDQLDKYDSGLNIVYDNRKIRFLNKITNAQIGKEFDVEEVKELEEIKTVGGLVGSYSMKWLILSITLLAIIIIVLILLIYVKFENTSIINKRIDSSYCQTSV